MRTYILFNKINIYLIKNNRAPKFVCCVTYPYCYVCGVFGAGQAWEIVVSAFATGVGGNGDLMECDRHAVAVTPIALLVSLKGQGLFYQ